MLGAVATEPLSARYRPLVLEFRVLGPLEVVGDDGPIRLGGARQRATLAILLLNANRVVSIDRIADDLYAGAPPVTAVTQVQRQISELRKLLGSDAAIDTRSPGYVITVDPEHIDLTRFERWMDDGLDALAAGDPSAASDCFARALTLWRGDALADLQYESFAQAAIERLEELRVAAIEHRIESELALGRHAQVVSELEDLARAHPLRERIHGQLMRALYGSGRHAEALDAYRSLRTRFVDELGLEPTPELRALEQAILRHDAGLAATPAASPRTHASAPVLVVADDPAAAANLLSVAAPIAGPAGEVVLACLLDDIADLRNTTAELNGLRSDVGAAVRAAAFTSTDRASDAVRLASVHDAAVVLVEHQTRTPEVAEPLSDVLLRSPADVGLLTRHVDFGVGDGIYTVFGGNEHDWAALELGARLAAATAAPLRLVGTAAGDGAGAAHRDASRLLADAALAVQRVVGVPSEPLLAAATAEALAAAVSPASLVVAGISPRWRQTGIGATRRVLIEGEVPALIVHRGLRPGILAPRQASTRYTWSLQT
jgi:DNA-binding SARP family transcriptional activator